jgi:hypothetical protein
MQRQRLATAFHLRSSTVHVAPPFLLSPGLLAPAANIISRRSSSTSAAATPHAHTRFPWAARVKELSTRVGGWTWMCGWVRAGWRRSLCTVRGSGSCGPAARRDVVVSGGVGWTCRRCSSGGRAPSLVRLSLASPSPSILILMFALQPVEAIECGS